MMKPVRKDDDEEERDPICDRMFEGEIEKNFLQLTMLTLMQDKREGTEKSTTPKLKSEPAESINKQTKKEQPQTSPY